MDIGKKIKVLRAQKGISQQELADSINKTRTLISHIEVTSKVNYYTLTEIANAIDVTLAYFTEEPSNNKIVNEEKVEYASLAKKIEKLERENELLNEIIQNQKEIITQLKDKLTQ
ncbi:MAG: helix-turn-helix domain-containing protein [Vicingus serpentipes]|nr:helix-turn-helix domain-containing protein [Vicingus serpentipes]